MYFDANFTCEICGERTLQLHCHEQWGFDDKKHIQYLTALRCVCEVCHDVIHFGRSTYAYRKSYVKKLTQHWCKVNNKTEKEFQLYRKQIYAISKKRANKSYVVIAGDYTLT